MEYVDFFSGKRVTLMGLGLLGRGVGDAEFLAPLCKELVVTDQKSETDLAPSLARLKHYANITYRLGEHREDDFVQTDMVIKAAGVPLESAYVAAAKKAGVPVYMSTALFARFAQEQGATLVGVTGTRGKSTIASLIHHTLVQAGKKAHLGGNIRGLSTLALLPTVQPGDIVVLELDSWQLQGFGDLKASPHIAVFSNVMPDHLNYYGGDMEKYFADKANIFLHQKSGDKLIVGAELLSHVQSANPPVAPTVPPPVPHEWVLTLVGEHNRTNAALAAGALRPLGLSDEEIQKGFASFEPVEGRLQLVREIRGVQIYNDNNATTPEATLAALESFEQPVVLIAGGADKNLDLEALVQSMQKCKKVLLLEGTGTDRLKSLIPNTTTYRSVSEALTDALAVATAGDVILFSPGFASFGMFKNEYDRNDQFLAAVAALQ